MIKQRNGEVMINDYIAPASVAFALNDVVYLNTSGQLAKATATTPRSQLIGLIQKTILSTDDDYADTKTVPVNEFHEEAEYEVPVGTGTLATTMVGQRFSLKDENEIDVTNEGQKSVEIVRFISATLARVKFITSGEKMELRSYQQVCPVADFVDSSLTGTLELDVIIPAGAVFVQSLLTELVEFAGDTSAVITVGDGSDVDRYNTGTPNVFVTAPAGVDLGVPAGTRFHAAAKTVTLIITSTADFTSVVTDGNGTLKITIFYYVAN